MALQSRWRGAAEASWVGSIPIHPRHVSEQEVTMRIAVIGAGLSGLTFAAAMKQKAPKDEVLLFERDESATSRMQGYAIGLRNGLGLAALAELGLRDAVVATDAVRVTKFPITNQQGTALLTLGSTAEDPNTTYRVQRDHLKKVLSDSADQTSVRFGMRCTGFVREGGQVTATFEGGHKVVADYLIACDGVGSAIRQQAVGGDKHFLGLVSINSPAVIDLEHPLLAGGYFLTLGDNGCSFFCYRQPGGVFWSYVVHAESEQQIAQQSKEVLLERVRKETDGWHEVVRSVVARATADSIGVRGYYDKDPISSVRDGRIWLIGDAAHPMSPFQGQGANMAIVDAVKLAKMFAAGADQPQQAAALEADIVKRGRKAILDSRGNARRFHETSSFGRFQRDQTFRLANFFIGTFSRG
jgi:salicylate hydroxylase